MTYLLSLNGHLLHTTPVSLLGLCISHKIFLWSMLSNKCCCAEYFCCELYVHWSNELWNTSGMLLLLILHTVFIYSNEDMCNVCHCCHFFLSLHIISYTLVCMVCILYSGFFSSLSLVVKWSICCRFSMCQLKWNAFGMLLLTLIVHIFFHQLWWRYVSDYHCCQFFFDCMYFRMPLFSWCVFYPAGMSQ